MRQDFIKPSHGDKVYMVMCVSITRPEKCDWPVSNIHLFSLYRVVVSKHENAHSPSNTRNKIQSSRDANNTRQDMIFTNDY